MGYLTTFTIYNDGIDLIRTNPQKFCDNLYNSAIKSPSSGPLDIGHEYFANLVHVQRGRHADDHTIYVHMGNCVTEVNAYSRDFRELIKRNPEFAKKLVKFMASEVKEITSLLKKEVKDE